MANQGNYNSMMSGPETTLKNTVDTDVNSYDNWLTGGSGTLNETTNITTNLTTPTTYTRAYTSTDSNLNTTTWSSTSATRPAALPTGVNSTTITETASGNPYQRAMDLRVAALKEELQGLLDTYNRAAQDGVHAISQHGVKGESIL